jgi:hypothetical protein
LVENAGADEPQAATAAPATARAATRSFGIRAGPATLTL